MKLCVCKLDDTLPKMEALAGLMTSGKKICIKSRQNTRGIYAGGMKYVGHFRSQDRVSPTHLIQAIFHD